MARHAASQAREVPQRFGDRIGQTIARNRAGFLLRQGGVDAGENRRGARRHEDDAVHSRPQFFREGGSGCRGEFAGLVGDDAPHRQPFHREGRFKVEGEMLAREIEEGTGAGLGG